MEAKQFLVDEGLDDERIFMVHEMVISSLIVFGTGAIVSVLIALFVPLILGGLCGDFPTALSFVFVSCGDRRSFSLD